MLKAIGSRKELTDISSFYECIRDIIQCSEVKELKEITHHICTTRFQHCLNVSYYSFIICRLFSLDEKAAARAGMLHDLFYYNRKEYNSHKSKGQISHSQMHSFMAAENAAKLVEINDLERDIIEKHMWPVTRKLPKYRESYVITFVDKYCAILEFLAPKFRKRSERKK